MIVLVIEGGGTHGNRLAASHLRQIGYPPGPKMTPVICRVWPASVWA